jgi:AAA ATPase domain
VLDAGLVEAGSAARVSPLVGRDAELAQLRDEWREAIAGRARLVLVSGEPGIGKTRLVDELRMQVDGVAVDARGYSVGAPIAYAMMTSWLRSQPVAARLTRLAPAELTELSRLLPELAERVPPPEPLPEAELRRRLFGAVVRALLAAGTAMLLVAATARREELDPRHPLAELIAGLQAVGRLTEIELHRLGRTDTGMLATAVGGAPLAAAELAGTAAAIGRSFAADALAAAAGLDEPTFVRSLDELWRRGIVRAHRGHGGFCPRGGRAPVRAGRRDGGGDPLARAGSRGCEVASRPRRRRAGARARAGAVRAARPERGRLGVAAEAADCASGTAGGLRGLRVRANETAPHPSRAPGVAAWHRARAASRVVACAGCPGPGDWATRQARSVSRCVPAPIATPIRS